MPLKFVKVCVVVGLISPSILLAQDGIILKGAGSIGIDRLNALKSSQPQYRVSIAQFSLNNGEPLPDLKEMVIRWDGALMLSVNTLVELAEGSFYKNTADEFGFYLNSPSDKIEIYPKRGIISFNDKVHALPEADWAVVDDAPYISYFLLSQILGFEVTYDEIAGLINVRTSQRWPREQRTLRELQWERLANATKQASLATVPLVLDYKLTGAPQADFSFFVANGSEGSTGNFSLNAVAEAFYLTNTLSLSGTTEDGLSNVRMQTGRFDPAGSVFGVPGLYQFQAGDVTGSTLPMIGMMAPGRGVLLRAAPLEQYDEFDRADIVGEAPAGWDVELYSSSTLVAVVKSGSDGLYRFVNVPLLYGINNFKTVMYGPNGQQRREFFQKRVGGNMLRQGETHAYSYLAQPYNQLVNVGKEQSKASDDWVGSARVDYGLSNQLTLSSFFARSQYSDYSRVTALSTEKIADYAGLGARTSFDFAEMDVGVVKQSDGDLGTYANIVVPIGDYSLTTSISSYGRNFFSAGNQYDLGWVQRRVRVRSNSPLTLLHHDGFLSLSVEKVDLDNQEQITLGTASYMHSLGSFYLNHNIESENFKRNLLGTSTNNLRYRGLASYAVGDVNLRSDINYLITGVNKGFETLGFNAYWMHDNGTTVNGNYTYRVGGGSTAQLRVIRKVDIFLWSLGVAKSSGSGYSLTAGLGVTFGIGHSPTVGTLYSNEARTPYSQVSLHLFQDMNGNGTFDRDTDMAVPEISAYVNNIKVDAVSREDGRLHLDKVLTTRRQVIQISPDDLADNFLVAKVPAYQISARPGQEHPIPIVLMEMGEVSGTMFFKDADFNKFPISGVRLQILNEEGIVVQEATSLSDGYYIFDKVYAGKWIIRLHPEQIPALEDLCMDEVLVELTNENLVLSDINLLTQNSPKKANP
jgi:hypothetical protein